MSTQTHNEDTAVPQIPALPPTERAEIELQDVINPKNYRIDPESQRRVNAQFATPTLQLNGHSYAPATGGLGDRARLLRPSWTPMQDRLIHKDAGKKGKPPIVPTGALAKVETQADWSGNYFAHYGPIKPEYEMLEGFTLYDVEVYVQQAVRRRTSLMFRNGYSFNGKNQDFVDYINKRIGQISYVMGVSWANFMREILTCLTLCSNCFLLKIRTSKEGESGGKKNELNRNRNPICAYQMIPPHTIFPWVEKGKITKWRRFYNWSTKPWEDYAPEDIIHLKWDRKPGHIFGTPRLVATRDDIFALRRLEENVELLFINYLFPLFHVKVGTDEAPAGYLPGGIGEVAHVKSLIERMPKEGVFVTDQRVAVDVVGANAQALDPGPILEHYKKRIFCGLGVSAMDMGEGQTVGSSTAENVSQALKDSIKYDLDVFSDQVSFEILRELFSEANFSLSVQNAVADVKLTSSEIDVDNKLKQETHATQLYQNNGIDHSEYRKRIGENPMTPEQEANTHFNKHVVGLAKAEGAIAVKVAKESPQPAGAKKKGGGKKGKSGRKASTVKKATPTKKATANKMRPENQHGKNLGPHKARSSATHIGLYSHLVDTLEAATLAGALSNWPTLAARAVDSFFARNVQDSASLYTKYPRMQMDRIKNVAGLTNDPSLLFTLLGKELLRTANEEIHGSPNQ